MRLRDLIDELQQTTARPVGMFAQLSKMRNAS